ncbi:hypothetical protein [Aeromonas simiae]|uniref:hypothetical protein n=1 Tax=Aeromonas simiae TaxID=218936 RepID=UPI00266C28FC|nr:hypothetical protein [Aeromonas simiae]MDO2954120.1 hypothetical protein [Aeromonas simiae]
MLLIVAIIVTAGYLFLLGFNNGRYHDVQCEAKLSYQDELEKNGFSFTTQVILFLKRDGRAMAYLSGSLKDGEVTSDVYRHVYFTYKHQRSNQYHFDMTETNKMMRDTASNEQVAKMYKVLGLYRDFPIQIDEKEEYLMFGSKVLPMVLCVKQ